MNSQIREDGATPNGIEVAIHYYCRCEPHPRLHAGAVREAIDGLIEFGLMVPSEIDPQGTGFLFTEKGKAWIELLCSTPLPVQIWIDPRKASQYAKID